MKIFRGCVVAALMLAAANLHAACRWPAWETFKQDYMSERALLQIVGGDKLIIPFC